MPERPSLNPDRLAELRLSRCESQASLAAKAKLSRRTVLRMEAGQAHARLSTIRKLAAALNVPVTDLTDVA